MTMNYDRLWKLLIDRKMSKTQMRLKAGISSVTLAKMGKGEAIGPAALAKICTALGCDAGKIVKYGKGEKV